STADLPSSTGVFSTVRGLNAPSDTDRTLGFDILEDTQSAPTVSQGILNGDFSVLDQTNSAFGWHLIDGAAVQNGTAVLREGTHLFSDLSQSFVVPQNATTLQFTIRSAAFVSNSASAPDAFEV